MEWPSRIRLVTRELPVIYDTVKKEVNKLWDEEKPDVNEIFKVFFVPNQSVLIK